MGLVIVEAELKLKRLRLLRRGIENFMIMKHLDIELALRLCSVVDKSKMKEQGTRM